MQTTDSIGDSVAFLDQAREFVIARGPQALAGLGILVLGWVFAGWVGRRTRRVLESSDRFDPTLAPFLSSLVRWTIITAVAISALQQWGIQATSLLAVLGAAGLAVGLALQGTLSNFASGVMLLVFRPFRVDDVVNAAGHDGLVIEIGIFATELRPPDGTFVLIPNSSIWGTEITNYTRNGSRRRSMVFGIAYDDDVDRGLEVLLDEVQQHEAVLGEPAAAVTVAGLGASSVDLVAHFWVKAEDFIGVEGSMNRNVKLRFDREGLSFPFPQRDVHITQSAEA